jgi:hypothetical protein
MGLAPTMKSSTTTLNIMTLSIMMFSIKGLYVTLNINDTEHN